LPEEFADGKQVVCASICLDFSGQELVNRMSNVAFSKCRAGQLDLRGFPDFNPILTNLKAENHHHEITKTYKVTTQVHSNLRILETLARKWLDEESTCAEAKEVIAAHNETYNPDGEMMVERRFF